MKSTTLKMLLSGSVISVMALSTACSRKDDKTEPSAKIVDPQENLDRDRDMMHGDMDMHGDMMDHDPEADLGDDMRETGDDMKRTAGHARDEVVAATRKTLDSISNKINELEASAADDKQELDKDTREMVDSLKEQRAKLAADLDRAGEVSEDHWDGFVNETNQAMDKLEEGYNNVLESMKTNE